MSFISYSFPVFAAALLVLYYALPGHAQKIMLLMASYMFYLWAGREKLFYILITTLTTYGAGRFADRVLQMYGKKAAKSKNRVLLAVYLAVNFGILAVCKLRFTFQNVLLPLGISFYMFQSAGYMLDVHRGRVQAERNFLKLALFVSYFPQLVQGPISRYDKLAPQLWKEHRFDSKRVSFGLLRMLWGYFKKLVIAERAAVAMTALLSPESTGLSFFVLTVFYAVRIYGDFTGGIDIAVGMSEALGITLPENFVRPFFSKNIAEYWRRWHITLGDWMKDYIFYPVSVSAPMRNLGRAARRRFPAFGKRLPVYISSAVTWFCTGIWHGITPNFILWGMINCAAIILSEELSPVSAKISGRLSLSDRRWYGALCVFRTFIVMNFIRALDLFPNVGEYFIRLSSMFKPAALPAGGLGLDVSDYAVLVCGIAVMFAVSVIQERRGSVRELLWERTTVRYTLTCAMLLAVLLMGNYGIGYDAAEFIYNQF